MPMTCPSCGRNLATGAKCLFCGPGTVRQQPQLAVPKGSTRPPKKSFSMPWRTLIVGLIIAAIGFAVLRHPEWVEKIKALIK
jgi:hypothetical protein